ncbi:MAG: amidohydrolase [Proteobacteria bacterium]|nr:amidohydrolase [Pseudomonadota bacterium]MBU1545888.1 amidohydrolase [Pseudomonadota bacterium]MBU2618938.1 amidohydrolase [Pseudomonadota bacterium]
MPIPDEQMTIWMRDIRRHLHRHPELAFAEFATARCIAEQLEKLGIPCREQVNRTGIVASLGSSTPNTPCVALRADMDALPIAEQTGLPFASETPGVMHACGHDGHVAMLLGAAALLKKKEAELPGRVVLIFQPAEEGDGGAQGMINEGAIDGVSMIFAGHIDRLYGLNEIVVQPGVISAFTDEFSIAIRGPGGHGAKPQETSDCIVAAGQLITSLQSIVARETHPCSPAVITVGTIHGGTAANVIASEVVLAGTLRTTNPETRVACRDSLKRMTLAMEQLHRVTTSFTFVDGYPPVINDPAAASIALEVAAGIVGRDKVKDQTLPSLGGEDFSFFLQRIPGCLVRFGAKHARQHDAPAHSPRFDFDEAVLATGAQFLAQAAVSALAHLSRLQGAGQNQG